MYTDMPQSRADALATGAKKYFTGQPCKNGHLAYRYTQSGTCSMCLRATADTVKATLRSNRRPVPSVRSASSTTRRDAALAEMKWIDVAAHPHHVVHIRRLAETLMQKRYPFLPKREAWRKFNAGFVHGVMSHPYRVHPADAMHLREQAALTLI